MVNALKTQHLIKLVFYKESRIFFYIVIHHCKGNFNAVMMKPQYLKSDNFYRIYRFIKS